MKNTRIFFSNEEKITLNKHLIAALKNGQKTLANFYLDQLVSQDSSFEACNGRGQTALIAAVEQGFLQIIKKLLAAGANVAAKDVYGKTAMTYASSDDLEQYQRIISLLLSAGGDISTSSIFEEALLIQAARSGQVEKVRFLINSGADPLEPARCGKSAIEIACDEEHFEIAELLK